MDSGVRKDKATSSHEHAKRCAVLYSRKVQADCIKASKCVGTDSVTKVHYSHGAQLRLDNTALSPAGVLRTEFSYLYKYENLERDHRRLQGQYELSEKRRKVAQDENEYFNETMRKASIAKGELTGELTYAQTQLAVSQNENAELKAKLGRREARVVELDNALNVSVTKLRQLGYDVVPVAAGSTEFKVIEGEADELDEVDQA